MNPGAQAFAPTRWTLILRARGQSDQARAALSELCGAYYEPVLRFLRCEGRPEDEARELAQDFFARVPAGGGFERADPDRGRFRSYLLGALKHFLADRRKHELRLKRGQGVTFEPLEAVESEDDGSRQIPDLSSASPDALFDRQWALAVIARAMALLQNEFAAEKKAGQFTILKEWLVGEHSSLSQAEAARRLGLSEGAVKVAIHRLRKRFRDSVRGEISQTLHDSTLVEQELRHLIAALS